MLSVLMKQMYLHMSELLEAALLVSLVVHGSVGARLTGSERPNLNADRQAFGRWFREVDL